MIRKAEFLPLLKNDYPTSDGRPMAETDFHRILMTELIETLMDHYAANPNVYVSGNLLLFYEKGNKRRHISPDVFVSFSVPKYDRLNYLTWEEGKSPDVVIELTSKTTRSEDVKKKFLLYQNVLKVKEYFLFDPYEDYLTPSMQGFRLTAGEYRSIRLRDDRLPSKVLGLHLERSAMVLRLWNPETDSWLPTSEEQIVDQRHEIEAAEETAKRERENAAREREKATALEQEVARLRQLLDKRNAEHKNGTTG